MENTTTSLCHTIIAEFGLQVVEEIKKKMSCMNLISSQEDLIKEPYLIPVISIGSSIGQYYDNVYMEFMINGIIVLSSIYRRLPEISFNICDYSAAELANKFFEFSDELLLLGEEQKQLYSNSFDRNLIGPQQLH